MRRYMFLIQVTFLLIIGCQSTQQTASQALTEIPTQSLLDEYEQTINSLAEDPMTEWSEGDRRMWTRVQDEWRSVWEKVSNLNDASLRKQAVRIQVKMIEIRISPLSERMSSLRVARKSKMSDVEKVEMPEEVAHVIKEALARITPSTDQQAGEKQDDADEPSSVGPLLDIILTRQLLAGLTRVGQTAASAGVQTDPQTAKDLETQLVRHVIDYIKDVQTKEEAFRKSQNLVASYSVESGEYKSEIQLTIRVIREAARKLGFNKAITQELLRPALEALDGKSSDAYKLKLKLDKSD